ncbi:3-hydroxyacyl-ACP dehydratase FabZ family protein [Streptomyces sp. NPDC018031]|uniref:3-hydroxyacyl-ACP dehydratase FabZ family protein n=1 Tax=Streptomyces sp. NPDC018031 TaxID=3365033 RepID=UPI0037A99C73
MPVSRATPVDGVPRVIDPGGAGSPARTVVVIDPAERVFAGHYPGFPIFPGVCLIEYVQLSALETLPAEGGPWRLAAVESTRFVGPVFPGDTVTIELTWQRLPGGDAWRCKAEAATERGRAARLRLRFEIRKAP